ncbi:N-acetylglucosamine-6-phosphate deacetylase [Pontibacillus halophilus JSM 076056 = DSM 19796]|uniref:N-acetylglucosamine-6-phosphate deacetylase n=1 Tax=Pontibacillus halophilus JSM 076056 = DSM 19796 TaxID=1385510 RepID=A0A0A5GH76_9BACI|nr:N-acetylglucosamine-6-phosphate deacetylase [Pontibacillus halophilus]KGX91384.1 N-acetylglucosamine-6-phosphate deacetylase [Pontibacillus halophilus JSM 076056 = DSM 19796]
MSETILFKNMTIVQEGGDLIQGDLLVKDGVIEKIQTDIDAETHKVFQYEGESFTLLPGFIDDHIHGAAGYDVMDATESALSAISQALPKEGTTSYLATTMTQSLSAIQEALSCAAAYRSSQKRNGEAELLGVHLEGPFLSPEKAGAQPVEHIISPNIELFKEMEKTSGNGIRVVTLAPEREGGLELTRYLTERNIVASIGHSNATYQEVLKAIDRGATQVTHLYNQMSGFLHREPGVVGATFLKEDIMAELIVDGMHAVDEAVELAYQNKTSKGLMLITDAMRAKCLRDGDYELGGQPVTVKDGKATLEDGTLAGSVLKMNEAVRRMNQLCKPSLHQLAEMASSNAAKQLGVLNRKGSIAVGKDADLVVVDESFNVHLTICRGVIGYSKEGER